VLRYEQGLPFAWQPDCREGDLVVMLGGLWTGSSGTVELRSQILTTCHAQRSDFRTNKRDISSENVTEGFGETGPPGFEPGFEASEASVMSKLYYGPNRTAP
jgi:hypothetical protein